MTTDTQSVNAGEIAEFLTGLYGLEIKVEAEAGAVCETAGAMASYVDGEGVERGKILCDLPAAAILGAALTQVPMGAVEDAVASGTLPDNLSENVSEVFNIAVNLLPASQSARLVLKEVTTEFGEVPACDEAVALKVDVQRYGSCKLFLF